MGIRPLPADLQATAIKNINEDPARIPKDIEYIKEWLKKQPHLNARTGQYFSESTCVMFYHIVAEEILS